MRALAELSRHSIRSRKGFTSALRFFCIEHLQGKLGISERRACRVIGQHRSSQRKRPVVRADEDALTAAIIWLACTYGRHGYRRVTALLRNAGWHVNHKRVARPKPASGFSHRTWSFGVLLDRHRK